MSKKAWVVTVDMGYGHQRAANPLFSIAEEGIITANSDKMVTEYEKREWTRFRFFYEFVSRMQAAPVVGKFLWGMYDSIQSISEFYPFRDLSRPDLETWFVKHLLKKGFCMSIAIYAKKKELPFISTFFVPAFAAARAGIKEVYCVVTDTDIARVWAPNKPSEYKIYYFAPTIHSAKRLMEYGVPKKHIFFTGFPLPPENVKHARSDLMVRIAKLDPKNRFSKLFGFALTASIKPKKVKRPLTIAYAVGGAGAQTSFAAQIVHALRNRIKAHEIRLVLVAGTRMEVTNYFNSLISKNGMESEVGKYIEIISAIDKKHYFKNFNSMLRETDILWTKPSELTFYAALGIPLILTPPLGAHEEANLDWILKKNAGYMQENPECVNEWLFEWIDQGMLAEAAFNGYMKAPRDGTENITKIIFSKKKESPYSFG